MSIEFKMPSLGADMEAGTLVEWKIKPGDVVKRGDVVAVVETDKGAIDVEIFESGAVEKLIVAPDTRVPVGGVLALIAGEASSPPSPLQGESRVEEANRVSNDKNILTPTLSLEGTEGKTEDARPARQKISPAARARAQQLRVALEALHGSGPGGVITLQDVEQAAKATSTKPSAPSGMREVIAAAMAKSKRDIPHYYLSTDVDYSATMAWLAKRNAELPIEQRTLPVMPLLRSIVLALQAFPDFNGYYKDNAYQPSKAIHLGVAIAQRGGGLIAPALLDAQQQSLSQLTQMLGDLVNRVRAGRLKNRELSDGTLTLTSLGDGGVDAVFPVIYPPQVAIIGAGTIRERAWAVNGKIETRQVITLSLAADHRVSNGRSGAQFLARIRDWLQTPDKL
jgi:pyruvate dehydrogenase E2 component (dihydrolipoamide acetyltransferase)